MSSAETTRAGPASETGAVRHSDDPLLESLAILTRLHGRPVSPEALAAGLPLEQGGLTPTLFVRAAERQGYSARVLRRRLGAISNLVLPAVLILEDGGACVLTRLGPRGRAEAIFPETGFGAAQVRLRDLRERYTGYAIFARPRPRVDDRMHDEAAPRPGRSWLWGTLWRMRSYYVEAVVATVLVNLLAVATALFIMNVYDRVVPNDAFETLAVLAAGTLLAVGFEFLARTLRGYFLDSAGRKADQILSGRAFEHAMGLRMEARPPSAGAFAAQLRELESLREFLASATLTIFADLPFVFFFIWIISLIGGPLYQVPLAAVPLVVLVGLAAQIPLSILMRRHMREGSLRHGLLVEAVEGTETLKTLRGEGRMQGRWEEYTALTGRSAARARTISGGVVHFAQLAQQCVTIGVVVWGVYLVAGGELTVGGLIACVILAGRALAPLGQVAGVLARYQHARAAYFMLDDLMRRPVERPAGRKFLHRPEVSGRIELREVRFAYPRSEEEALRGVSLRVEAGERLAVLGRVGSGKSTLLRLLVGLYDPGGGTVLVDGADVRQYDPVDLRRAIGYVSQDVRLFYGTLRENIAIGLPTATDESVLRAARIAGVDAIADRHPLGYDMEISERGEELSGGQRQMIALARAVLPEPPVLLLDEPTASMDHTTEQGIIARLRELATGRTLVLVTHKPTMLGLVDRIVVMDEGRVVADGPRDEVLRTLTAPVRGGDGGARAPAEAARPQAVARPAGAAGGAGKGG